MENGTKTNERAREWAFTINNPTDADRDLLEALADQITYMIIANEIGEEGTPHIQGCLHEKNRISFKQLQKFIPRGHIEKCIKSLQKNISYCKKDANYKEYGQAPSQGKRTDLLAIGQKLIEGVKVDEIVMTNPEIYHQYGRTLHKMEDILQRKKFRNFQTLGEWHYGPTLTGKTEYWSKNYNPDTHYMWKYDNGWQDGYTQQEIVVIDEFRGQETMTTLLQMIDKHPNFYVKRRGREPLPFMSKLVIITSPMAPSEVYHNLQQSDKIDQLLRRVKIVEHIKQELN